MQDYDDLQQRAGKRFKKLHDDIEMIDGTPGEVYSARFVRLEKFVRGWPEDKLGPLAHWLAVRALEARISFDPPHGVYGALVKDLMRKMTAQQRSLWTWRLYALAKHEELQAIHVMRLSVRNAKLITSGASQGARVKAILQGKPISG